MAIPKITAAEFLRSALAPEQFPREEFPEVAFIGRSNVGKSSLINTLLHRKRLVRTSARPGCTQAINFFLVNQRWRFVDLPGYGYAKVSKVRRANWLRLIHAYLEQRHRLVAVVFLLDSRRLPEVEEVELLQKLQQLDRPVIPVLTKADKLKASRRARQRSAFAQRLQPLGISPEDPIWFSAVTREGRKELWTRLLSFLTRKPDDTPEA